MKIDDGLLEKFFLNQCTEEEALEVVSYLEVHPEKLDELLPEHLWEDIAEMSLMPAGRKEELLQSISAQIVVPKIDVKQSKLVLPGKNPKVIGKRAITWGLSVAATLLLVIGLSWWFSNSKVDISKLPGEKVMAYTLVKINYGKDDMKLNIADGSVIYLKPGGELRYLERLSKKRRDFRLKGVARFKVAADQTRPFNVYAGGTVTTALGTDFTISSQEDGDKVSVLLHSGRVVVSPDSGVNTKGMKRTYLLPGNKLLVNKLNFNLTLIKNGEQFPPDRLLKRPKGQTELSATEISFRNQSLDKIFKVLQSDFSAVIEYDKAQLRGMYFTGSFERNEQTVSRILNEIALLNHLTIEKRDTVYMLKLQSKN